MKKQGGGGPREGAILFGGMPSAEKGSFLLARRNVPVVYGAGEETELVRGSQIFAGGFD